MKHAFLVFGMAVGLLVSAWPCVGQVGQLSSEKIEVKIDIAESDISAALTNLKLATDGAEAREVYFFDTPQLDLFQKNIILRARKGEKKGDFVVKIRPIDSSTVASHWFDETGFKCGFDVTTNDTKEQCVLKEKVAAEDIEAVTSGTQTLGDLLTKKQRAFAEVYGLNTDLIARAAVIGPIASSEWSLSATDDDDISADLWVLPEGQRFLEISATVASGEEVQTLTKLRQLLKNLNVRERELGENKTEFVMDLFLKHHLKRSIGKGLGGLTPGPSNVRILESADGTAAR